MQILPWLKNSSYNCGNNALSISNALNFGYYFTCKVPRYYPGACQWSATDWHVNALWQWDLPLEAGRPPPVLKQFSSGCKLQLGCVLRDHRACGSLRGSIDIMLLDQYACACWRTVLQPASAGASDSAVPQPSYRGLALWSSRRH